MCRCRGPRNGRILRVGAMLLLVGAAAASFVRGGMLERLEGAETVSPAGIHLVPDEYPTIQSAIDAALPGDMVMVRPGVYRECLSLDWRPIRVVSEEGPTRTFIMGDGSRNPIVSVKDLTLPDGLLQGFFVTGSERGNGAGLFAEDANVTVRDCVFERNQDGGARLRRGAVRFEGCQFRNNSGAFGGGVCNEGGNPTFIDCVFEHNEAGTFGGAFYNRDGRATFSNTTFDGNATRTGAFGGGLYSDGGEIVVLDSSLVRNRSLDAGGAAFIASGGGRFERCTFAGNIAGAEWTIASNGGTALVLDSTICGSDPLHVDAGVALRGTRYNDACFADCNRNGLDDLSELASGRSEDLDGNMVPDECDRFAELEQELAEGAVLASAG
ncbi:MAG: right-handed parallel beta-helix repeat-containing protein [Planctomycetota bacterium]|nr:right-handed parallel beta-helix repeat-containing protein [Planctomycetota bacterium]